MRNMKLEAKQRLILSGPIDSQMLQYLKKNNVGGPYLKAWHALKNKVSDRNLQPLTVAITEMHQGVDEDDALDSVHFGAEHPAVVEMVKTELSKLS